MGRLLGIARAERSRAPLIEVQEAVVDTERGIAGDARGAKPGRQITVLFKESWADACRELETELPWVTRRANLLVEDVAVPRQGNRLCIGEVLLEVIQETQPCALMESAHRGLRAALRPEWRGGVCCNVLKGGTIRVGDVVLPA